MLAELDPIKAIRDADAVLAHGGRSGIEGLGVAACRDLERLRACAELLGVEAREGCVLDELRARLPPITVCKTEESP